IVTSSTAHSTIWVWHLKFGTILTKVCLLKCKDFFVREMFYQWGLVDNGFFPFDHILPPACLGSPDQEQRSDEQPQHDLLLFLLVIMLTAWILSEFPHGI